MYRGYKIRNALLDDLNIKPPSFLADSKTPLPAQTFKDVEDVVDLYSVSMLYSTVSSERGRSTIPDSTRSS